VSEPLERARELIERARRIVVVTGAGVSAESGVPTFRGAGGLWKSHRPEELATPEAFARDPLTVWEWYAWRRSVVSRCVPNPGHVALARFALDAYVLHRAEVTLVTQNVDGLHHRAAESVAGEGEDPARAYPLEVHGALHRDRCSGCRLGSPGRTEVDLTSERTLPRCELCGSLIRPDVVWFGEPLDAGVLEAAFDAARSANLCLVAGTSSVVYPAAAIPEIAMHGGAAVVEVNPDPTPLSRHAVVRLRGAAGIVLPTLLGQPTPCGPSPDG